MHLTFMKMQIHKIHFNIFRFSLILSFVSYVTSDVFTAVVKMEMLAKTEQRMISVLNEYISASRENGEDIFNYVEEFQKRFMDISTLYPLPDGYMGNPINAFHFVKRMHVEWEKVLSVINCDDCIETVSVRRFNKDMLNIHKDATDLKATADDYEGAALALVRLWQTYKLDLTALLRGYIRGIHASPLTTEDILYICRALDNSGLYFQEVMWLQELYDHVQTYSGASTEITSLKVIRLLASAYAKYGMPWEAERLTQRELDKDPGNEALEKDKSYFSGKAALIPIGERTKILQPDNEMYYVACARQHYEELCRGDIQRPSSVTSHLKCFLRKTNIPIYYVKEEVFSVDPRLSMLYDVITGAERNAMKELAKSEMMTSVIVSEDGQTTEKSVRVSQTAWLDDSLNPVVQNLNRRVALVTGLSTEAKPLFQHAESFQVLNYGIGGMYEPHLDPLGYSIETGTINTSDMEEMQGTGDRMATFMFYLSDVTIGGATVFTKMNITVPVVEGGAAFWYNYKRNGVADERTEHAGCPVLLGSKWVSNKWIRQEGQLFRRRCGLKQDSIDNLQYKGA